MLLAADLKNSENCYQVHEYQGAILEQMLKKEENFLPIQGYMENQQDLKPKMRSLGLEWVSEVALKFKLLPETYFLTVNYVDRFLSKAVVARSDLQLVLVAAMKIAGKYEEIYPPENQDYLYICDGSYTEEQLLECEAQILQVLDFDMSAHTTQRFLERYLILDESDDLLRNYAQYLIECSAIEYDFVGLKPSLIAASALYLSKKILKRKPAWSPLLE